MLLQVAEPGKRFITKLTPISAVIILAVAVCVIVIFNYFIIIVGGGPMVVVVVPSVLMATTLVLSSRCLLGICCASVGRSGLMLMMVAVVGDRVRRRHAIRYRRRKAGRRVRRVEFCFGKGREEE